MNERQLTVAIEAECDRLGLLWHHCPDSRRCEGPRGKPDLLTAGPQGILLAEIKDEDGDTSPSQDAWLYMLHQADVPYAVWRPADWDNGTIKARLRGLIT